MQPRPDQRQSAAMPGSPGSRSGAGDIAGALGYPGIPAAVPNQQQFRSRRQPAGVYTLGTFTAPGRIWTVILSYFVSTDDTYSGTTNTFAEVDTAISGISLGVVELGASDKDQGFAGQSNQGFGGMPVLQGESVILNVSGGATTPHLTQRASVIVLYSIP
jgi:hypothetical protein